MFDILHNTYFDVYQIIGIAEILIGFFGYFIAYTFKRNSVFRFKLALVYTVPVIAGIMSLMGVHDDVHIIRSLLLASFMMFSTILYWREVKILTTKEGYHKKALVDYLDDVPDMICVKDTDNRYTYCNKALQKCFRLTHDQIIGKTDLEIGQIFKQANERFDFDYICDKSDRVVRYTMKPQIFLESGFIHDKFIAMQVYKAPLKKKNNHGEIKHIGFIGIARDLTYDVLDHQEIEELLKEGRVDEAFRLFCVHKGRYDSVRIDKRTMETIIKLAKQVKEEITKEST